MNDSQEILICWGTLMYDELYYPHEDGEELEEFNILEWSSFPELNDDEENKFYAKYRKISWLLNECELLNWEEKTGENIPLATDTHVRITVKDEETLGKLKEEVRAKIRSVLEHDWSLPD